MISHYLIFLKDVLKLTSCTSLDAQTLNYDYEIDIIYFI
jgi:hypothetical protein